MYGYFPSSSPASTQRPLPHSLLEEWQRLRPLKETAYTEFATRAIELFKRAQKDGDDDLAATIAFVGFDTLLPNVKAYVGRHRAPEPELQP